MSDVRGRGTLLAWNHETPQQRDEIIGRKLNLLLYIIFIVNLEKQHFKNANYKRRFQQTALSFQYYIKHCS